jgi:two-component system, NarL family, response regulator YdfI
MEKMLASGLFSGDLSASTHTPHDTPNHELNHVPNPTPTCMIRVLIVAASAIVQMGLEAIVRTDGDLVVVDSADRIDEQSIDALAVEVVLVSMEMTEETLSAVASLVDLEQPAAVVWLVEPLQDWLLEALRAGVLGLLPNDATADEILAAINATAAGLMVLHPDLAGFLKTPAAPLTPVNPALTQREIEILGMLAEGMANKTIARRLHISEHTVKFHISSIFAKLSVSSRTEAVTIGIRQGLILL